ncbi:hypothetical protein AB0I95_14780 [Micromonospora sp. NPDC049751]|uniref:hypothetical protein n=1 Tax=Micromonospora sp. NPDC049751 TaxID=3154837 RepID=UPI0033D290AB
MIELKDRDLALVRVLQFPENAPTLARFRDIRDEFDGDGEDDDGLTWWQFFGTEITEPPQDVEIVAPVRTFTVTASVEHGLGLTSIPKTA